MSTQSIKFMVGGEDGTIRVKTTDRTVSGVEVLVRITHSGLCGTDGHDRTAGCGLGHEGIGIVQEVGREVTAVQVGDRVGCRQVTMTSCCETKTPFWLTAWKSQLAERGKDPTSLDGQCKPTC